MNNKIVELFLIVFCMLMIIVWAIVERAFGIEIRDQVLFFCIFMGAFFFRVFK